MFDKKVVFLLSAALIVTTGLTSGYYFYNREINFDRKKLILQNNIAENIKGSTDKMTVKSEDEKIKQEHDEKTNENTKMIYEYYYKGDGITKIEEEPLPPALINKNREIIENMFDEWSVITFNTDEIVLRKDIEGTSVINYILKEKDGFVAVFYDKGNEEELLETTDTPVASLPQEEQELLKEGIYITGNNNLLKILQDYES